VRGPVLHTRGARSAWSTRAAAGGRHPPHHTDSAHRQVRGKDVFPDLIQLFPDPDPTWAKSSSSDRNQIRIHNTGLKHTGCGICAVRSHVPTLNRFQVRAKLGRVENCSRHCSAYTRCAQCLEHTRCGWCAASTPPHGFCTQASARQRWVE
jgi:hypothetical protein